MSWLQLRITTTREHSGPIEDALLAAGALSITMEDNADQPILEPALGETPLWNETRITGLYTADVDIDQTILVAARAYGSPLPDFRWEILEEKDWVREWMADFKPIRFGKRLWVCPSWDVPPDPNAANLMLDPGLAFGTGTHPTTALCLEWLDSCDLENKIVVDYGCGSGILAIAALLLGAKEVIAIDNDPQALLATAENAKRNHIDPDRIGTFLPGSAPKNIKAHIVVANILAGPLAELAPLLSEMCLPDGYIALSGILSNQSSTLTDCYKQWFDMNPPA
ncbi:MAG: ribosomal protein L11 methyltransferase, partial [Gammaproteobacteria bacterium]